MDKPADFYEPGERNARASARGDFKRWLYYRYRRLDLVEMADEPTPVSLTRIFVPLRADEKDIDDDKTGPPDEVEKEEKPGREMWNLLAEHDFIALSGRPGSGKTTLVQACILGLCGESRSELQDCLALPNLMPLPLILRHIPQIERFENLDAFLTFWWQQQQDQAKADKQRLDVPHLRAGIEHWEHPSLLMFDGMDEIGGPETRAHVLKLAQEAHQLGYRILLTGRPSGYQNLTPENALKPLKLLHLQPLHWQQIQQFIRDWHKLRKEWKIKQEAGVRNFLEALQSPRRAYLLTLARRPIFLTLMALVHCTRNEMPDGRADLYKAIVDLYLHRQERHRQRTATVKEGAPMPHWPEKEPRLVLGNLAWESQKRGSETEEAEDRDKRQMNWRREEILALIQKQLKEGPGRFTVLQPGDAEKLLEYFLHPAGLLTEPAENRIQFAHLSFQEYLCAEFLYKRATISRGVARTKKFLKKELFDKLAHPGWDEVGMLLLTVWAAETDNEGHFEILSWLDPANVNQADLLMQALVGRELSFTAQERIAWLPVQMGAALIHPLREYAQNFRHFPELEEPGVKLFLELLRAKDDENAWEILTDALRQDTGHYIPLSADEEAEESEYFLHCRMKKRWLNPNDDNSWAVEENMEARTHALLALLNTSAWQRQDDPLTPLRDQTLLEALAHWLQNRLAQNRELIWKRNEKQLPYATRTAFELDSLLPAKGGLWRRAVSHIPMDACLLQGESGDAYFVNDIRAEKLVASFLVLYQQCPKGMTCLLGRDIPKASFPRMQESRNLSKYQLSRLNREAEGVTTNKSVYDIFEDFIRVLNSFSQPEILLSLHPHDLLPASTHGAIILYQALNLGELSALFYGEQMMQLFVSRSWSLSQSRLQSQSWSRLSQQPLSQPFSRSMFRTRSLSQSLSLSLLQSQSQSHSWAQWLPLLLSKLSEKLPLSPNSCEALHRSIQILEKGIAERNSENNLFLAVEGVDYYIAARDWFQQQAQDCELARRRGLPPGEPLPRDLKIFDEQGVPKEKQERAKWQGLRKWVDDDRAVLEFMRRTREVTKEEEKDLRAQLAIVRGQAWSPQKMIDAVLADWPENEPERDFSLVRAEQELLRACNEFLETADK
ncbi:MAG: NACHT domain-containing protein [Gammaproteobacteria bacterium]|nr:NACHT domain-containing protein [Gammaproteobacteria bacterium]